MSRVWVVNVGKCGIGFQKLKPHWNWLRRFHLPTPYSVDKQNAKLCGAIRFCQPYDLLVRFNCVGVHLPRNGNFECLNSFWWIFVNNLFKRIQPCKHLLSPIFLFGCDLVLKIAMKKLPTSSCLSAGGIFFVIVILMIILWLQHFTLWCDGTLFCCCSTRIAIFLPACWDRLWRTAPNFERLTSITSFRICYCHRSRCWFHSRERKGR